MSEALLESIKEGLRVVVLAIIPLAISAFERGEFDVRVMLIAGAIALLKFVDSLLHETAKDQPKKDRNEGLGGVKGITGF